MIKDFELNKKSEGKGCVHRLKGRIRISTSWLVGCFGFNGPLRQYFSLYRAISQREGEREEKG